MALKKSGAYKGIVSVGHTLNDQSVESLFEFVEYFEDKGVESVYIVFPWYIPEDVSRSMDDYVRANLPSSFLRQLQRPSWHSYTYHLSPDSVEALKEQMRKISARSWKTRVRFHPALELDEVEGFVAGRPVPAEGKTSCVAVANRVDVMPNGDVTSCKFFPEMRLGNLERQSFSEIWQSETFARFRAKVSDELMPVCSKCTLLYSTG